MNVPDNVIDDAAHDVLNRLNKNELLPKRRDDVLTLGEQLNDAIAAVLADFKPYP